jgi:hypothetical protein
VKRIHAFAGITKKAMVTSHWEMAFRQEYPANTPPHFKIVPDRKKREEQ